MSANSTTPSTGADSTTPSTTPSVPPSTTPSIISTTPISTSSSILSTTPSDTSTSLVSVSPTSTAVVAPTSSVFTSVPVVSSTVTVNPATTGGTGPPEIVTITSTQAPVTITPSLTAPTTSSTSSPTPSMLGSSGSSSSNGSGLSTSGKIAIAVVIPIVVIALLSLLLIFLWRKRKARKTAEEQRKNEMAEYGFNPNNDPTLPVGAVYTDGGSEGADDGGYRGWGTTSSAARKPSTTLGSNGLAANGMAYSDTNSQPGGYGLQGSPDAQAENWSGEPLTGGHPEGYDGVGALGGAAVAGGAAAATLSARNNRTSNAGVQRGPSNASSSYSHNPPHSESSNDMPGGAGGYYQDEVPYNIYNDVAPTHGPYGEGPYGGAAAEQPVIRDVQARRNTKIERAPTFPQTQGGIAQNF